MAACCRWHCRSRADPGEAGVLERAVLRGPERLQVRAGGPYPGRRWHGYRRHLLQLLCHPVAGGQSGRHSRQPEGDGGHHGAWRRCGDQPLLTATAWLLHQDGERHLVGADLLGRAVFGGDEGRDPAGRLAARGAHAHAQRRPPRHRGVHHRQEGPPTDQRGQPVGLCLGRLHGGGEAGPAVAAEVARRGQEGATRPRAMGADLRGGLGLGRAGHGVH